MIYARRPAAAGGKPTAVAVVVPVNDEQELLPRCISALREAVAEVAAQYSPPPGIVVFLVLDACTDASVDIARASGFTVITHDARAVGAARSRGVDAALQTLAGHSPDAIWIANTDADSVVPRNWLTTQIELAEAGCDLMIGTVRPDALDLSAAQRAAWVATHVPGHANGHVHGANLGVRADAYRRVGGFDGLLEHEDVILVERLRALGGLAEIATDECWVLTSGRQFGRTPGGYARHLREDLLRGVGPLSAV